MKMLLATTDGITSIHLTENDAIIFAMIKADDDKKVLIACHLELLIRATIISMHLRSLLDFFFFSGKLWRHRKIK